MCLADVHPARQPLANAHPRYFPRRAAEGARREGSSRGSVRLGARSELEIEVEFPGVGGPPAAAVELRPLLDGKRHVVDIALHTRRCLQRHGDAANDTRDLAADDHALGGYGARHPAFLADDDLTPPHVALDFAVDLERALADDLEPLADDLEIIADDRLGANFGRGRAPLGLRWLRGAQNGSGIGLERLELLRLGGGITREHRRSPDVLFGRSGDANTAAWWNCVGPSGLWTGELPRGLRPRRHRNRKI